MQLATKSVLLSSFSDYYCIFIIPSFYCCLIRSFINFLLIFLWSLQIYFIISNFIWLISNIRNISSRHGIATEMNWLTFMTFSRVEAQRKKVFCLYEETDIAWHTDIVTVMIINCSCDCKGDFNWIVFFCGTLNCLLFLVFSEYFYFHILVISIQKWPNSCLLIENIHLLVANQKHFSQRMWAIERKQWQTNRVSPTPIIYLWSTWNININGTT